MKHDLALSIVLLVLTGFCACYVLAELVFAVSAYPLIWLGAVAFAGLFPYVSGLALRSRPLRLAAPALASLVLASHFVALNPVKPFRLFYRTLGPGTSVAQVKASLAAHFPRGGRFAVPVEYVSATRLSYTLDPTNGSYNSEIIVIELGPQGVGSVAYLPD